MPWEILYWFLKLLIPKLHIRDTNRNTPDEIIRQFNERWFAGWDAAPMEQRVRFINIAQHVSQHPDYVGNRLQQN